MGAHPGPADSSADLVFASAHVHVPVTVSSPFSPVPPLQVPPGERPSAAMGGKRNPADHAGDDVEEWLRAREVQM